MCHTLPNLCLVKILLSVTGVGYLRLLITFVGSIHTLIYVALTASYFLFTLSNPVPLLECIELETTNVVSITAYYQQFGSVFIYLCHSCRSNGPHVCKWGMVDLVRKIYFQLYCNHDYWNYVSTYYATVELILNSFVFLYCFLFYVISFYCFV